MRVTVEYDDGTVATYGILRFDRRKNTDGTVKVSFRGRLQQAPDPKPSPRSRVAEMDGRITRTETLLSNCMEEIGAMRALLQRAAPSPRKVEWRSQRGNGSILWLIDTGKSIATTYQGRQYEWCYYVAGAGQETAAYEVEAQEKAFRRAVKLHGPLELVR